MSPATAPAPSSDSLWVVSARELGTQRLFRMHYDGPEGEGSFKLTLRLAAEDAFQISTVDRLTRRWWGLSVDGDQALLLDHRAKTYCRYGGEIEIAAVPLGPLPFSTLPALLLGRLPLAAATPAEASDDEIDFRDRFGRRWSAIIEGSRPVNWILWGDDGPEVWWQRRDDTALLSSRHEGLQLRWRQVVVEAMEAPLGEVTIPPNYSPGDCAERGVTPLDDDQ